MIALGSGGIKPCVSAFVGDQLSEAEKALAPKVFAAFYWAINLGSLAATLSIPKLLRHYGPEVAFGLPGVLMGVATLVFWLGRKHYKELPPSGPNPHSFWRVVLTALRTPAGPVRGLDRALGQHPPEAIEGVRAVLRMVKIFALVPFFWMLFDQKASAWVLQARRMQLDVGPFTFEPAQLQAINPLLVMILIPLTTGLLYPACARLGVPLTPLRRMTLGMFSAGASFVMVAIIQMALVRGQQLSVVWQTGPYVALTLGEVLVLEVTLSLGEFNLTWMLHTPLTKTLPIGLADSYASMRLEVASAYTLIFFVMIIPLLIAMQLFAERESKR